MRILHIEATGCRTWASKVRKVRLLGVGPFRGLFYEGSGQTLCLCPRKLPQSCVVESKIW